MFLSTQMEARASMISNQYKYKSNALKERYIAKNIEYNEYRAELEKIINEEKNIIKPATEQDRRLEEIYEFEQQQFALAQYARNPERKTYEENQKIYNAQERYYEQEVPELIEHYKNEAKKYRAIHDRFQWIIIIGSAVITSATSLTIFINLPEIAFGIKIFTASCSLIITIASSFTSYFKYRERSMNLQHAADDIEYEYDAVKLGAHEYGPPREKALRIFVNRITDRTKEQKEQQRILEQPSETKLPQNKGINASASS